MIEHLFEENPEVEPRKPFVWTIIIMLTYFIMLYGTFFTYDYFRMEMGGVGPSKLTSWSIEIFGSGLTP